MSFSIVLNQIITMFIIGLVGFVLYKKEWISNETIKQISSILLKIIMPLIIIKNLYIPFNQENLNILGLSFLLSFVLLIVGIIVSRSIFRNSQQGIERFSAGFSNASFLGIPLVSGILGSHAVIYMIPYVVGQSILMWTYGVSLLNKDKGQLSIQGILRNPAIIAFVLSIFIFVFQIRIPIVLIQSMNYLTSINTPLAMMILGCYVAQVEMNSLRKLLGFVKPILTKLVLVPLIVLLIFKFIPLNNIEMFMALFIVSGAPTATSLVMFSAVYDSDVTKAAQLVSYSTLLSSITLPIMILIALSILS